MVFEYMCLELDVWFPVIKPKICSLLKKPIPKNEDGLFLYLFLFLFVLFNQNHLLYVCLVICLKLVEVDTI